MLSKCRNVLGNVYNVINKSGIMVLCKMCDRYLELLHVDNYNHDQVGHDAGHGTVMQ